MSMYAMAAGTAEAKKWYLTPFSLSPFQSPCCRRGSRAGDERPHPRSVLEAYRREADGQLGRRCGGETLTPHRLVVFAAKRLKSRGGALKGADLLAGWKTGTCTIFPFLLQTFCPFRPHLA